tara:strand:- start:1348 stop:3030 length:1683 start_codon:yes stop_codon:yes gene_type:complete
MAVKFLTGLSIDGNIDLNSNQIKEVRIDNLSSAPTGSLGRIYYDDTTDKLRLYNGGWVDLQTGNDGDTTYDLTATGSGNGTATINLVPSTGATDSILYTGSGTTSVTRSGTTITITSNDQFDGTVTSVAQTHAGNAFSVGGSPITSSGTLAISVVGNSAQYINGAGDLVAFPAIPQGTVTSVNAGPGLVKTGTAVAPIISVDYTSVGVIGDAAALTGDVASGDLLLIGDASNSNIVKKATFSQIPLDQLGAAGEDVNLGSNKIINLANGTASTDAINLGQLNTAVAGLGVFRGAYNAATNTPNLDTTSNVAANQGDFWVVSVDGTFFTTAVEVGDLLFANEDIPANSGTNALSKWTVVAADQNVAGVGTTSGNTEIGVAGFNSATFSAAANGWISVKAGGISDAQLASTFNKIIGTDTNLNTAGVEVVDQINVTDGVITSMSKRTLPNAQTGSVGVTEIATQVEVDAGTDTFRYVTPATLASSHSKQGYSNDLPSSAGTTWDIVAGTHGLGTGPFIVQTYEVSGGAQVFMDVEIAANGTVTFSTQASSSIAQFRCNILKV